MPTQTPPSRPPRQAGPPGQAPVDRGAHAPTYDPAYDPAPYDPAPYGPAPYDSSYGPAGFDPGFDPGFDSQGYESPYGAPPLDDDQPPVFEKNPRRIRSHGRRKRRVPIWTIILVVLGMVAVGAGLRFVPGSPLAPAADSSGADADGGNAAAPTPTPTPKPLPFRSANVTLQSVATTGFLSWALMDRRSGEIVGSANLAATSTTASMIKAWLASDYLRRAEENGQTPSKSRLADLETLIRDSDNDAADRTYDANGKTASIERLISMCKLTDSKAVPGLWSNTTISAEDTVRMGACIADGHAAGEKWTPWILDMMRKVRGTGDFGIRKALPAAAQAQVAIKNGWLLRDEDNNWHTSCMAIGDTWVLSVLQRYPSQGTYEADFQHTANVCQQVATQLLNPEAASS